MYKGKKLSLIFPAFNEEENILYAVQDFKKMKIIHEIIVVDNNSKDKTASLARKGGAKVVKEDKQGYGFALTKGLSKAQGDYIILCEPDGTFIARDLPRLLKPIKNVDVVFGTRTKRSYISSGANMRLPLRLGNIFVAKFMQMSFKMPSISDCGCTFRVFKKEVVKKILPKLTVGGSHFLPQTVILTYLNGFSFLEVPVHYRKRIGTSKITGSFTKSLRVGTNMVLLILRHRFSQTV